MSALGQIGTAVASLASGFDKLTKTTAQLEKNITQFNDAIGGSAVVGGMSTFNDIITLLSATFAREMMPAIVEFAATLLDWVPTIATIGQIFSDTMTHIVNIFGIVGGVVQYFLEALNTLKMALEDAGNWILRKVSLGAAGGAAHTEEEYAANRERARTALERVFAPDAGGGEQHKKNAETVVKAMTAAFGKQGQVGFGGIADAQKQIQMRAFQTDIQAQILKVNQQQLDVANKHLEATRQQAPAVGP